MSSSMIRLLMIAGGIFAACFGLFIVATRFYDGITDRQTQVDTLTLEEMNLNTRLIKLEKSKKEVDKWKTISLPGADLGKSALMYKNYLQDMLLRHNFSVRSMSEPSRFTSGNARQAAPLTTNLSFDVVFEAKLGQLTDFLKEFYSVNVPHLIKNIAIEPIGKGGDAKLVVTMKVDALSMSNTPTRHAVIPNPTGTIAQLEMLAAMKKVPVGLLYALSQVTSTGYHGQSKLASNLKPEREYATMQKKNVFAGLASASSATPAAVAKVPDPEILKYTQLTSITANFITEEGLLRNRKTNKYVKLRAEGGVNDFEIRDGDDQLVLKGKVLAIKPRDLVFETKGKAYVLHIGQFVEEALKKELTTDELKQYDAELTASDQ